VGGGRGVESSGGFWLVAPDNQQNSRTGSPRNIVTFIQSPGNNVQGTDDSRSVERLILSHR
jgi:hypothetical protein